MFLGFLLGCSSVFLLLLSSAVCRPASKSDNYPYAWGYRPRLLPDGSSSLQSAQQRNPGTVQSDYSPPGASSSQNRAPTGPGPVHPPKAPEISPRSGTHVNSPVASGSRIPASSRSSQSAPRMARAQSQPATGGSGNKKPSSGPPSMFQPGVYGDLFKMVMAGANPQSAPSRSPVVGPAAPNLFPGSYPGAPPPFSQDEQPSLPRPPVPPPIYIIQSSNGYMHFRQENSRSKYSPEYLEELADGGDPFAFLGASDPRGDQKV